MQHNPLKMCMTKTLEHKGPKATIGTSYKLVSLKGTLLGVLTIPDRIADMLVERDFVRFPLVKPLDVAANLRAMMSNSAPEAAFDQIAVICRSYKWEWNDAVQIHGVSLEELERQPGFSFAPGIGYLRSVIS